MPVRKGRDSKGTYYVWGQHGKKYYGRGARSRAAKQGKAAEKRFLRSVKYCQRCGREVYPDSEGRYPLFEVIDERYGISLLVCENCKKND